MHGIDRTPTIPGTDRQYSGIAFDQFLRSQILEIYTASWTATPGAGERVSSFFDAESSRWHQRCRLR